MRVYPVISLAIFYCSAVYSQILVKPSPRNPMDEQAHQRVGLYFEGIVKEHRGKALRGGLLPEKERNARLDKIKECFKEGRLSHGDDFAANVENVYGYCENAIGFFDPLAPKPTPNEITGIDLGIERFDRIESGDRNHQKMGNAGFGALHQQISEITSVLVELEKGQSPETFPYEAGKPLNPEIMLLQHLLAEVRNYEENCPMRGMDQNATNVLQSEQLLKGYSGRAGDGGKPVTPQQLFFGKEGIRDEQIERFVIEEETMTRYLFRGTRGGKTVWLVAEVQKPGGEVEFHQYQFVTRDRRLPADWRLIPMRAAGNFSESDGAGKTSTLKTEINYGVVVRNDPDDIPVAGKRVPVPFRADISRIKITKDLQNTKLSMGAGLDSDKVGFDSRMQFANRPGIGAGFQVRYFIGNEWRAAAHAQVQHFSAGYEGNLRKTNELTVGYSERRNSVSLKTDFKTRQMKVSRRLKKNRGSASVVTDFHQSAMVTVILIID